MRHARPAHIASATPCTQITATPQLPFTSYHLPVAATAEPAGNALVTLTYNAAGQRVQKDSGGTVTNFLYDHQTLLQESDEADGHGVRCGPGAALL